MTEQQPPPEPTGWQPPPQPAPGPPPPGYPAYAPYPGGPGGPGVPSYGQPGPPLLGPTSKGMAVAALVLAVLGMFVVTAVIAIVLAIIVLSRAKDGRDHGKGLAVAALVIAPLWLLLIVGLAAIGIVTESNSESSSAVKDDGNTDVTDVTVGDCVKDEIAGDNYYSVDSTPCSSPHRLEAYAGFDLPDGDYPGEQKVLELAEDGCSSRYEQFVGRSYDDSVLDVEYLYPLKSSWRLDKSVTCFVGEGAPSTGTLEGADK